MSSASPNPFTEPSDLRLVCVRVFGHILLALSVLAVPELGDNRYFLTGFIILLGAPVAAWIGLNFKNPSQCWLDPLCDLTIIIIAAWLLPEVWVAALCLGLMVSLSPSVNLHPRSSLIYAGYGTWLLIGLGSAYWLRVPTSTARLSEGWLLVAVAAIYPTLIVYANWQRRRASTLMEQAHLLKAVTGLSGSIAHDFNNVLMTISGHTELAILSLPHGHPARNALEEVVNGTTRASLLCGQLLAFTGKEKHGRVVLDVNAEVQRIVDLLRTAMPSGVNIQITPLPEPVYIYGERTEFQQVLLNLIVNAGESMDVKGGLIEVTIGRKNFRLIKEVVVTVKDQGAGIPADVLDDVFDPFYTTKDRGHGLGLASVKRIVLANAGEIELDSQSDRGTQVTVSWPETQPDTQHTHYSKTDQKTVGVNHTIN